MTSQLRIFILLSAVMLSACTSMTARQYETCIVGMSAVGGAIGAISSTSGVLPGVAVGAGVSAFVCAPVAEAEPPPRVVAAAEPADSDGDGVSDDRDRCPGTAAGVSVDARGCARDGDGEGVPDHLDRCPGTPAGVSVDRNGCPLPQEVVLTVDRLGFAFDSAALSAESKSALDAAVAVINSQAGVQMDVVGHTDSSGPEAYNQKLSERRAQAAVDYLVSQGVDASRLRAVGRGEAEPAASNDSRDGRARNRRVELVVR